MARSDPPFTVSTAAPAPPGAFLLLCFPTAWHHASSPAQSHSRQTHPGNHCHHWRRLLRKPVGRQSRATRRAFVAGRPHQFRSSARTRHRLRHGPPRTPAERGRAQHVGTARPARSLSRMAAHPRGLRRRAGVAIARDLRPPTRLWRLRARSALLLSQPHRQPAAGPGRGPGGRGRRSGRRRQRRPDALAEGRGIPVRKQGPAGDGQPDSGRLPRFRGGATSPGLSRESLG